MSFTICTHKMIDFDFWFHYDCGRYIVQTGQIPTSAIGSWYGLENNLPWISHEWLFGVICYYLANWFGLGSLPFIAGAFMAIMLTWIVAITINKNIKHPVVPILVMLFLSFISTGAAVMRPQLFLYLFTMILFLLLRSEIDNPSKKIFWLILLTIAWVNLHGGSYILIFFFSFLFFALDGIHFKLGRLKFKGCDKQTSNKRFLILLICFACVALNAHGLEMYSYPFTNMNDATMLSMIREWRQLNLASFELLYLVVPLIYFIKVIASEKDIDGYRFIFLLGLTAMTLRSVRFGIQLNLVASLLLLDDIVAVDKHFDITYVLLIPFILLYFIIQFIYSDISLVAEPFDMTLYPSDPIIEKTKEIKPQRLYNHYDFGGYLLYNEIPVFIDGRADIYSSYNMKDFKKISNCDYGFKETLEQYNFDYFMVTKSENLYDYLIERTENYELITEDEGYALFKNTEN